MILMSVFESIKRECFPFPRGWVMGHCSVGDAGRDMNRFLVKLQNIRTYKIPYTRTFILIDNRAIIEKITDYIIAPQKIGDYNKNALFFVIKLL
jgi:hypothetical protein